MRKNENVTLEPCDKADDTKYSFPEAAINREYTISVGYCRHRAAIDAAKRVSAQLEGPRSTTFMNLLLCRFQNHVSIEGREHFSKKGKDILLIKVFGAWNAQRKRQIVYEINKIAATMHTLVFADGALGAKNARDCSQKQYFDAGMERTNRDRNGQKSEKSKYNYKKCSYRGRLGVKKVNFLIRIT